MEKEIRRTLVATDVGSHEFAIAQLTKDIQLDIELLIDELISRGISIYTEWYFQQIKNFVI